MIGTPRAQARIDVAAVRSNVAELCPSGRRRPGHGGGEGRRVRPRAGPVRHGGRGRRGAPGSGPLCSRRRWRCAPPASTEPRGSWPGCWTRPTRSPTRCAPTSTCPPRAPWAVAAAQAAAEDVGRPARLHLKVDTGLGRGGAQPADWPELVDAAVKAAATGAVEVVGVWSHLAHADDPHHPTVDHQLAAFREAVERRRAGRGAAAGAAPGELGGDPDPAGHALRPGPPGAGGVRPVADP